MAPLSMNAPRHSWYPKTVLPNQLRIISAPMAGMESVALGIWMAAGGRYESARLCGISHFLEHLIFKGTLRRTARQIKEAIEGLGGSMNAFTDTEFTCLYAKVPVKHAASALDVLMDMALHPRFDPRDVERVAPGPHRLSPLLHLGHRRDDSELHHRAVDPARTRVRAQGRGLNLARSSPGSQLPPAPHCRAQHTSA